jgi:MFS family permease
VASLGETGRGARLGWFSSANDIGATAGPLVGGFVLYFTASYSTTYLTVAALGVVTLIAVLLLPDTERTGTREVKTFSARAAEFRQGLAEVFKTRPILITAGIEAVMYLGYGAFLGFLPLYAKTMGLNDAEIAVVLGAQLGMAMVAKPITGRLSDRVGRIPVIVGGLLLCAVALPLIFRSESLTAFVLVTPLLGLGVGAVTPVTNALIADLASARRLGAAMGVFGTIWDIGEAAGAMIAGFLIGGLGYAATFDVLAAMAAAAALGLVALVRDPKKVAVIRAPDGPVR